MRTISPFEFVRRFHHGVTNHDGRYVWFLGAGCSASSGIGDAASTTLRWLEELKYLETGNSDEALDWAPDRFAHFNPEDPAALYGDALVALFYTEQEQERELERINADAEPGFGYATLAQLVTQPDWGERCNTIVTTNFDDLAADALYLYSQRKPQVLTHESFDRRIRISNSRPTILKIYGDAHLGGPRDTDGSKLLRSDIKDRLRAQFTESALIFTGYGGRDESVADLLSGLPKGAPAGGIYWVNANEPGEPLRSWLEERNTIWTPYSDFEGLMFLMRREFSLGHPRIDRFDKILRRYDEQYRTLAARDDLKPDTIISAPRPRQDREQPLSRRASDEPDLEGGETRGQWTYEIGEHFDRQDVISEEDMQVDFPARPHDDEPSDQEENGSRSRIDRLIAAAVEAMANGNGVKPETDTTSVSLASTDTIGDDETVETPDQDATPRPNLSLVTTDARGRADAPEAAEAVTLLDDVPSTVPETQVEETPMPAQPSAETYVEAAPDTVTMEQVAAVEDAPAAQDNAPAPRTADTATDFVTADEVDDSLELPRRLLARADAAELDRRYLAAIQDSPANARLLSRYAQFLNTGRRDHDGAEHYFNRAIDANPEDSASLREFAQFLTRTRRDYDRAEECYRLALRVDFEDTETLCAYAEFLWKVRGDHAAAGECYQLAVDGSPRNASAIAGYAAYLQHVERKDDAAYALLKLAAASTTTDPAPAVQLAEFVADKRGDLRKAEAIYLQAVTIQPDSAETYAAAATFMADLAKKTDEAEKLFQRAVEADAASPEVLRAYALFTCRYLKDSNAAEKLLNRAMEADPGNAKTALAYAQFQEEERSDLGLADEYFRRAVHLDPLSATILAAHARFLHKAKGNPAAAEERYRKALALDSKDSFALTHYGNFLLHEREDMKAAEPLLERAVEVKPRNAAALADLGLILREKGEVEAAEKMFRRAVAADPRRVATLRRYARVVNTAKTNPKAAEAFYDKALAENPNDPATLCGAAQAMFSLGKREEGLSMLDRAFEAALDDEPSKRDPDLLLELWFYRYAFDDRAGRDAIKAALWLVRAGARATRNDLDAVLKFAVTDGHREPDLLSELASVACGESKPEQLQRFNVA